jgi:hypothetical protein
MRPRWLLVTSFIASSFLYLTPSAPAKPQYAQSAPASAPAVTAPGAGLTVEPVVSPAGPGSSEPQITVQGNRLILSWIEVAGGRATLKFAERTDKGWSTPATVYAGDNFFVNSFDVPSVRALADGSLVAHWLEMNGPSDDASQVRLAWSKDGGRTWTKPANPHHDGTQTEHGFVSLFQSPNAGLGLVWIDGRLTNPQTEEGNMSLRATAYDAGGKQLGEAIVNPRVCECCSTASAPTSEGVIVAYRGRDANNVRDIWVSRLVGGHWAPPVDVHRDGWQLDACPINGPAISALNNDVAVAWFNAKGNQGHALVAFSHDAGKSFTPPIKVDDAASLGRLGVAMLEDGTAAVTWIESAKPRSQFRVRIVNPSGKLSSAAIVANAPGERYPRIAHVGNELVLAWSDGEGKSSQLRTARVAIGGK